MQNTVPERQRSDIGNIPGTATGRLDWSPAIHGVSNDGILHKPAIRFSDVPFRFKQTVKAWISGGAKSRRNIPSTLWFAAMMSPKIIEPRSDFLTIRAASEQCFLYFSALG